MGIGWGFFTGIDANTNKSDSYESYLYNCTISSTMVALILLLYDLDLTVL